MFNSLFTSAFWISEALGITIVTAWALIFSAIWAGLETVFPFLRGGFGR